MSGSSKPSARTHSQGIPAPHLHPKVFRPCTAGMVLTDPADAETNPAIGRHHETSFTGWCRYAPIAQFESTTLHRSPDLNIPMIPSSKKLADQFGSLSSPDFSRTLQAISKDCSIRSVSVIAEKTEPRPICSSTSSHPRTGRFPRHSPPPRNTVRSPQIPKSLDRKRLIVSVHSGQMPFKF